MRSSLFGRWSLDAAVWARAGKPGVELSRSQEDRPSADQAGRAAWPATGGRPSPRAGRVAGGRSEQGSRLPGRPGPRASGALSCGLRRSLVWRRGGSGLTRGGRCDVGDERSEATRPNTQRAMPSSELGLGSRLCPVWLPGWARLAPRAKSIFL